MDTMALLMEPHIIVLRGQAEEPTPPDNDSAAEKERVEGLISLALGLWDAAKRSEPAISLDNAAGLSIARDWHRVLSGFLDILRSLSARAKRLGLASVAGLEAMANVARELEAILDVSPDVLMRARQDAAGGRTRTIGEVRRALRDRLHA